MGFSCFLRVIQNNVNDIKIHMYTTWCSDDMDLVFSGFVLAVILAVVFTMGLSTLSTP